MRSSGARAGSRKKSCRLASRAARYSDCGVRLLGGLAPQVGRLGAFRGDVQPLPGQPLDHLLEQHQHPFQRRQPRDAAPIRRAAGHGRPIDQQRRQVIVRRDVAPGRPLAQKSVLQESVPGLLRQPVDLEVGQPAGPVGPRPLALGDRLPLLPILRDEHLEHLRDAVAVLAAAVAGDHDAGHGGRLGQFDLHPLAAAGRGDPAVVVSVQAVVQVLDLVDRVAGKQRRRAGHGAAFGQGQVLFAVGAEDLQFVDARLRVAAGFVNGHAHEPGLAGAETPGLRAACGASAEIRASVSWNSSATSRGSAPWAHVGERPAANSRQTQAQPPQASFHLGLSQRMACIFAVPGCSRVLRSA